MVFKTAPTHAGCRSQRGLYDLVCVAHCKNDLLQIQNLSLDGIIPLHNRELKIGSVFIKT
jgi:hypothetical protein